MAEEFDEPDQTILDPRMTPQRGSLLAGKYRIEGTIGVGGMGVVLAAMHEELGERVAIKCLLPELVNDEVFVARFQREARAAVKIRSEHSVRVLDVAKTEMGVPYMVMEFLEGKDLGGLLQERLKLPPTQALHYILQACEALAEAHAHGIVHRDLKPENLFLTTEADGTECIKVMDFGISKMASTGPENLSLTKTSGGVMGSPLYMAPEQMRSAKDADPRTDIWALGAILFELICGDPPFVADSLQEIVAMIVQDPTPSLEARAKAVSVRLPAGLAAAVERTLKKSPAERYEDIAAFANALAQFSDAEGRASAARAQRVLTRRAQRQKSLNDDTGISQISRVDLMVPRHEAAMTQPQVWSGSTTRGSARPKGWLVGAGVFGAAALTGVVVLMLRHKPTETPLALPEGFTSTTVQPSTEPPVPAQPNVELGILRDPPPEDTADAGSEVAEPTTDEPPTTDKPPPTTNKPPQNGKVGGGKPAESSKPPTTVKPKVEPPPAPAPAPNPKKPNGAGTAPGPRD